VQYIVKDLEDRELARANDARSAWDLIEAEWSDAVVTSFGGSPVRGWMKLSIVMEDGEAVIMRYGKPVGGITVEGEK
jgi:hypothetical protein